MGCNLLKYLIAVLLFIPIVLAPTMGGSTFLNNVTYPGNLTYYYSTYPWIFVNEPALIKFYIKFNNSDITDGTISLNVSGLHGDLIWNSGYASYPAQLIYNISEVGDKDWFANTSMLGYAFNNLSGTFKVTDSASIGVKLWKDVNGSSYKNSFGYIFAVPYNISDKKAIAAMNYKNALQPIQDIAIWGDRTFGFNKTNVYRTPGEVWHAPYTNGEALIVLPKNQGYLIYFVSGNYVFNGDFSYAYYTKTYTSDVYLDYVYMNQSVVNNYVVTRWDLEMFKVIMFWVIYGAIVLLLIGCTALSARFAPATLVFAVTFLILMLPAIYYIMKLLFWGIGGMFG